jgi:hypothetical protein
MSGEPVKDVAEHSPVVSAIETFELFRAYIDANDVDARAEIDKSVSEELKGNKNGD